MVQLQKPARPVKNCISSHRPGTDNTIRVDLGISTVTGQVVGNGLARTADRLGKTGIAMANSVGLWVSGVVRVRGLESCNTSSSHP